LAVLRGSLGLAYVQLSCVTDVGLVCVVERYDLTELKEYYYYFQKVFCFLLCIVFTMSSCVFYNHCVRIGQLFVRFVPCCPVQLLCVKWPC